MNLNSPLAANNFKWDQALLELGDPLNMGLLSILVIHNDLKPVLVGTAFIVSADGNKATAITAAHCFEYIRSLLHPLPLHHPSAIPEFLPPPKAIDLKQVKALYMKDGKVFICPIEISIWDNNVDLAVCTINAPSNESDLFRDFFWIESDIPGVGEEIVMIGFSEMEVIPTDSESPNNCTLARELMMRIGKVEEIFQHGHLMLKGPCIQTTVAISSGMSGGLIAKWNNGNGKIKPFAFISYAPEPQPYLDRSLSGHSCGSILNPKITIIGDKKQKLEFSVSNLCFGENKK